MQQSTVQPVCSASKARCHRAPRPSITSAAALLSLLAAAGAHAQQKIHFTYLWHLEQPIYWPDRQASGVDRYERAWESVSRNGVHPLNNLNEIFGLADRVNAYQWRPNDSINAFSFGRPEAGAQISFSGGLIENIQSLSANSALGYSPSWTSPWRSARSLLTFNGPAVPRADIVLFSFHHALMPLIDESTMRKQIQLYKSIYPDAWGTAQPMSQGFFPSEMAFSTRMIPVLQSEGVQWSIVSAEKISRACADFPAVFGSGGINCDPPNKADQINPAQGAGAYYRLSIDRGCAPAEAAPFSLTPRRAKYVNPETGAESSIIVVPSSQSLSWKDGYSPQGNTEFDALTPLNNPSRPMLIVLAHDGDNAWGGGYSYYMEATPNRVAQAANAGYVPTVVQRYLADHPVPANDFVHVEDGAWVNADGDFGAPQFINWNWPLINSAGKVDIENGWHIDPYNWAIITAMQNRVDTAEQIWLATPGNAVNIRKILYPDAGTNAVERAWHYFMGSLNSGFMYYGTPLDHEVKQTIACNNAARLIDPLLNSAPSTGTTSDKTAPTIWVPQRHPWNPGSINFGPQWGYQQVKSDGDFFVWTFIHDVSGVPDGNVKLLYRLDADGQNHLSDNTNETFAGGPGVGAWQEVAMTKRTFPKANVFNDPTIDLYQLPTHIADQYFARINNQRSVLIDYYVQATDAKGNVRKSPIQHVFVGDGVNGVPPTPTTTGGGGGGGGGSTASSATVSPATPTAGQSATITYAPGTGILSSASSVYLHYGFNTWSPVISPDVLMTRANATSPWTATVGIPTNATVLDVVFNNGAGVWDSNNGSDWHFAVTPNHNAPQPYIMDGSLDAGTVVAAQNGSLTLRVGLRESKLYVACPDAGEGNDHFIFIARTPGTLRAAPWAKAGQVAGWDAFLADENDGSYSSWFDAGSNVAVQNATGSNGGWLEGTIDLAQKYGSIPSSIAVAFAPYPTNNNAGLLSAFQVPASVAGGSNSAANLDASEYAIVDLCALRIGGCRLCPADIADDAGLPLPPFGPGGPNAGLNEGDYNAFFSAEGFFVLAGQGSAAIGSFCDIADDAGNAPIQGPNNGINEGDYNAFFNAFFLPCP